MSIFGRFKDFPPAHWECYTEVIVSVNGENLCVTFRVNDVEISADESSATIREGAVPVGVWNVVHKKVPSVFVPDSVVQKITEDPRKRHAKFFPSVVTR